MKRGRSATIRSSRGKRSCQSRFTFHEPRPHPCGTRNMAKHQTNSPARLLTTFAFFGAISAALSWAVLAELGITQIVPAFRGRAWIVAAVVGAGVLIGVTRLARVMHTITGFLLAVWLVVCLTPLPGRLARPLKTESPPVPADA